METYDPFDVVVVPFPFTDRETAKRRPALVLSHRDFQEQTGHGIMAMITTGTHSSWPNDVAIREWQATGLPHPSVVRAKLFTLDNRLVLGKLGKLSARDTLRVQSILGQILSSLHAFS